MLDIKFIRENANKIKETAKNKNIDVDIDKLFQLNKKNKKLLTDIEKIRERRNAIASKIKSGEKSDDLIKEGKDVRKELNHLNSIFIKGCEEENKLMLGVPNIISEDTPIGPDESGNKVLKKFGKIPKFNFKPKDHMELGRLHNLIDTKKSAIISGARFNYLFNEAVFIQFALIQFVFDTLTDEKIIKKLAKKVNNPSSKPFTPVIPPVIAKAEVMKKMDRFDPIEDRYYFEQDDSLFIGSAEHTLGPLHMNEIIDEKNLPIRYVGYSTAFRREAGTYGKDTAGILRRHQFDKTEMETFTQLECGLAEQELIVAIQEYLVQQLNIPYQVVLLCSGDMGKPDFRQIDIECWMPGQNKYRETHTSDYMTDFQARRLNIKYKTEDGEKKFVHMNDATAFAVGRILIAILENNQQADGSIVIPEVLRKYIPGNLKMIKKK